MLTAAGGGNCQHPEQASGKAFAPSQLPFIKVQLKYLREGLLLLYGRATEKIIRNAIPAHHRTGKKSS